MAYTSKSFLRDLAIYSTGAAVGAKNSAKFASYAAKKGIQLAGVGATRVAPTVARAGLSAARANPVGASIGAALLAREAGLLDPVDAYIQQAIDDRVQPIRDLPGQLMQAVETPGFKPAVKRKVSKYSKAVKAGMSAVKRSKFLGAKGKISNAKTAFTRVNKVASAVNKGKKVASKGVTGVIKRAVGRFL